MSHFATFHLLVFTVCQIPFRGFQFTKGISFSDFCMEKIVEVLIMLIQHISYFINSMWGLI